MANAMWMHKCATKRISSLNANTKFLVTFKCFPNLVSFLQFFDEAPSLTWTTLQWLGACLVSFVLAQKFLLQLQCGDIILCIPHWILHLFWRWKHQLPIEKPCLSPWTWLKCSSGSISRNSSHHSLFFFFLSSLRWTPCQNSHKFFLDESLLAHACHISCLVILQIHLSLLNLHGWFQITSKKSNYFLGSFFDILHLDVEGQVWTSPSFSHSPLELIMPQQSHPEHSTSGPNHLGAKSTPSLFALWMTFAWCHVQVHQHIQ